MSFLTLFILSSLLYIVNTNPTKHSDKIKECGCDEKLDKFHNEIVMMLYAMEMDPVEYKEPLEKLKEEVLSIIESSGMYPDIFDKELSTTKIEIQTKASSKVGFTKADLQSILDNLKVRLIHAINSPDFKLEGCKKYLNTFSLDCKNILVKAGMKSNNFLKDLENFVANVLEVVATGDFDPLLLEQILEPILEDIDKSANAIIAKPDLLVEKLGGCLKDIKEKVADPDFSKLNVENYINNLLGSLFLAIESKMPPLMDEFKLSHEDEEYFKSVAKDAITSYIHYLIFQMQEKRYKGSKHVITSKDDDDILVSFSGTEED